MFTCFSTWLTKYRGRFKGDFHWSEWILSGSWGIYDYWIIKLNVMQNILSHAIVFFFFAVCWWFCIHFRICFYFRSFRSCLNGLLLYEFKKYIFYIKTIFSFPFIPCDKHQSCSYQHIIHESWVLHLCYHLINSWKFYYYQTAIISFLG